MREIPDAVMKATGMLHQDIQLWAPTLEEKADTMIETLDAKDRMVVKNFLEKVLRPDTRGHELRYLFRDSCWRPGQTKDILRLCQLVLQKLQ